MARPGRPERNRATRSFRQFKRFHHVINSDKVFGTHTGQETLDQRPVVADDTALHLPFLGIAKEIESRAAYELQPREQREDADHPGSEGELARRSTFRSGLGHKGRREMKTQREGALELLL